MIDPADGQIPYLPAARARQREIARHAEHPTKPEHIDPQTRCLPGAVPRSFFHSENRIVQPPGYVVFLTQNNHASRIIPLDGRPFLSDDVKLWMGDSRGRWEGNTLVIEVRNQNAKGRFDMVGNFATDRVRIVERWTIVDANTLDYRATFEESGRVFASVDDCGAGGQAIALAPAVRRRVLGRRMPRGRAQRRSSPAAGRPAAMMGGRLMLGQQGRRWCTGALAAAMLSIAVAAFAQGGHVPQRVHGQPDISGQWQATPSGTYDITAVISGGAIFDRLLQEKAGKPLPPLPSRVVDPPDGTDSVPAVGAGEATGNADSMPTRRRSREHIDPRARCLPGGVPREAFPTGFEFRQYPGVVVFLGDQKTSRG